MLVRKLVLATLALPLAAMATLPMLGRGTVSEVSFPADFSRGVLYTTIERADTKQYLQLYAPPAAIAAAKKGEPLPDGTVLTMLRFNVQLDATGTPVRGADGHLIKTDFAGYSVMQKQRGWGADHPPALRNGEWAYRRFTANREVDDSVGQNACLQCHKKEERHDFIFSRLHMTASK